MPILAKDSSRPQAYYISSSWENVSLCKWTITYKSELKQTLNWLTSSLFTFIGIDYIYTVSMMTMLLVSTFWRRCTTWLSGESELLDHTPLNRYTSMETLVSQCIPASLNASTCEEFFCVIDPFHRHLCEGTCLHWCTPTIFKYVTSPALVICYHRIKYHHWG